MNRKGSIGIGNQLNALLSTKEAFMQTQAYKDAKYWFIDPFETEAWVRFVEERNERMKMQGTKLKLPPLPLSSQAKAKLEYEKKHQNKKTEQELKFKNAFQRVLDSKPKSAQVLEQNKQALQRAANDAVKLQIGGKQIHLQGATAAIAKKKLELPPEKPLVAQEEQQEQIQEQEGPVDYIEKQKTIEFDPYQIDAITNMLDNPFTCTIGAAGTGKTTITNAAIQKLIDDFKQAEGKEPIIIFCSFTGRAARNLAMHLPTNMRPHCRTIHWHLEYHPEMVLNKKTGELQRQFVPGRTKDNPLNADIIVIDEAGNVPVWLWNKLVDAMKPKTTIIQLGDINQLPPVNGKSILGYAMQKWPTKELKQIHRQALDNPIIAAAHNILQGYKPDHHPNNFVMIELDDDGHKAYGQILKIVKKLHQQKAFDPFRDALIVPQNVGVLGQENLNTHFTSYFNPAKGQRVVISAAFKHVAFAPGDKVMLLQNNNELGLTNGMIGKIRTIERNTLYNERRDKIAFNKFAGAEQVDIDELLATLNSSEFNQQLATQLKAEQEKENNDEQAQRQASHVVVVEFEDQSVEFRTVGALAQLTHAYAFTVHKAQGGEYPMVVIVCHTENDRMLFRELLYTAVTRAIKQVVFLYNKRGLLNAIGRQRIKGHTLHEKAQSFMDLQDKADHLVPDWPESW